MTGARPEVDAETIVVDYLSADSTPTSSTVDGVADALPRGWTKDSLRLRVTRLGGAPRPGDPIGHLNRARIQVDAFGPDSSSTFAAAARALADLRNLPSSGFETPGAVVTAVEVELGIQRADDPPTNAARYVFGVILYGHAVAT